MSWGVFSVQELVTFLEEPGMPMKHGDFRSKMHVHWIAPRSNTDTDEDIWFLKTTELIPIWTWPIGT